MGAVLSTHRRLLGRSALSVRPIQHPSLSPLSQLFRRVTSQVFRSNEASLRLWRGLGFTELAVIPKAGRLKGNEGLVS